MLLRPSLADRTAAPWLCGTGPPCPCLGDCRAWRSWATSSPCPKITASFRQRLPCPWRCTSGPSGRCTSRRCCDWRWGGALGYPVRGLEKKKASWICWIINFFPVLDIRRGENSGCRAHWKSAGLRRGLWDSFGYLTRWTPAGKLLDLFLYFTIFLF